MVGGWVCAGLGELKKNKILLPIKMFLAASQNTMLLPIQVFSPASPNTILPPMQVFSPASPNRRKNSFIDVGEISSVY